jgi:pimeloyl-ACP methyl ester carboxylesterase
VRATLGLLNAMQPERAAMPRASSHRLPANHYRQLKLPDGRMIEYLLLGDPKGRPFLWLPKNYGLIRWTAAAERALAEKAICMISTVRAGYGEATAPPPGRSAYDVAVEDLSRLLDRLRIQSCPWATLGDDIIIALKAAGERPGPVSSIIACGPTMPVNRPLHYARMPMWPRFIRANARYAPRILPFLLRAGHRLLLRSGGKGFLSAVLRSSAGDLAALERDDVVDAMVLNIEVVAPPGRSTLPTYAAEMVEAQEDWEPLLAGCHVPLTCFAGRQDPHIPFETLTEYVAKYPQMRLIDFPGEGHLAFLTRWPELVDLIDEALAVGHNHQQAQAAAPHDMDATAHRRA